MRKRLSMISLLGLVAACSASAQTPLAERPIRPATGEVKPAAAPASPGEASRGSSRAAGPEESSAAILQEEEERRATESRRKMKKRPGFRDEVPSPRV
jgi:hypothetical protein